MSRKERFRTAWRAVAWIVVVGLVVTAGRAIAGDEANQQAKGSDGDHAQAVADSHLAARLAAYGEHHKDALALILAAKIAKATPTQPMDAKPKVQGPEGAKHEGTKASSPIDAHALLEKAMGLCGEDATLKTLATRVKDETVRGAAGGPRVGGPFVIPAGCTHVFDIEFRGLELAAVAVGGAGLSDIDMYIFDNNNFSIGSDTRAIDDCYLGWYPRRTGWFRIEVRNIGSSANAYELRTN